MGGANLSEPVDTGGEGRLLAPSGLYLGVCNWFQTFIYMGAFLFLLFAGRKLRWEQLIPAVIFIGGFLFHMAWEGKGQYTICYFILLIPYAYAGFGQTIQWLAGSRGGQETGLHKTI